jgi:hypothetical protein
MHARRLDDRRVKAGLWRVVVVCILCGCGDDRARAGGDGTDSDSAGTDGDGAGPSDDSNDESGGDDDAMACSGDGECDDADPCTVDACTAGACAHEPIAPITNECRPQIDVEFPPRAATLTGTAGAPTVTVVGSVRSGVGAIASLTIDGAPVAIADDGAFTHDVDAQVGGNVVVLEATDELGNARRRVQSFLWSTGYDAPTRPGQGMAEYGAALYLGQESIDDGDRTPPLDDVASLLNVVFENFDVSALFDQDTPIAHYAGYDIYITDLSIGPHTIGLAGADGGLQITAQIDDILGDLVYDCTTWECELAGGDSTGGFSVATLGMTAHLALSVSADHQLVAQLASVDVVIDPDDVEVWSDNAWTDFLLSVVEVFVHDQLVAEFEATLEQTIEEDFGPVLTDALGQLVLGLSFDFPNLGNARAPIVVDLALDFRDTDFHDGVEPPTPSPPQGGAVILRGGGYPSSVVTPYDNDGVPRRNGCALEDPRLELLRGSPLEIGLADDLLNQLLHAGWRGGLLEFPLTNEQLGGGGGIVESFDVDVSGMLAPTASDCVDGELRATIGDIRIDADLVVQGEPVTFTAYTTLVATVSIEATGDGVTLGLGEVQRVETELTANDEAIAIEPALVDVLEAQIVDGLLGDLGGLGSFSLPEIDLGGLLGLPPGEAVVVIHVEQVDRTPGTTVLGAHL